MKRNPINQQIKVYLPNQEQPFNIESSFVFEVGMSLDYSLIRIVSEKHNFRNKDVEKKDRKKYIIEKITYQCHYRANKLFMHIIPEVYLKEIEPVKIKTPEEEQLESDLGIPC